jgi:hypothetical protein
MDDHSHAVTVPEGFTDLDFPAEAVAFCAAGYYFVFKLDAKLAARLFSTRQQFRAVASDLPRQIAKRFPIGRRNVLSRDLRPGFYAPMECAAHLRVPHDRSHISSLI